MWTFVITTIALMAPYQPVTSQPVTERTVVTATTIQATGIGRAPAGKTGAQARLMAQRAAQVRAVRNLSNRLGTSRARNFRYLPTRSLPNGWVEVPVESSASAPAYWTRTNRHVEIARQPDRVVTRTTRVVQRAY